MGVVELPVSRPFAVASLYLQVGVGLNDDNLVALAAVFAIADEWGLPVFAAGDFNMGPAAIKTTSLCSRAGALTLAPKKSTCVTKSSATVIDFAIAHRPLAELLKDVCVDSHSGLATHRPVIFKLCADLNKVRHTSSLCTGSSPFGAPLVHGGDRRAGGDHWLPPLRVLTCFGSRLPARLPRRPFGHPWARPILLSLTPWSKRLRTSPMLPW